MISNSFPFVFLTNNTNRASLEKSDGAFFQKFFEKFSNTITCTSDLF